MESAHGRASAGLRSDLWPGLLLEGGEADCGAKDVAAEDTQTFIQVCYCTGRIVMGVFKMTEIIGTASTGVEDAIQEALGRASQTVRNMHWFEVKEIRGTVKDGSVGEYQVRLAVGFKLED